MAKDSQESKDKLMQIVDDAVHRDEELRKKLDIGDKFRFIRDKLRALQQQISDSLTSIKVVDEVNKQVLAEDERLVYVYLFNAHGIDVQTWTKMVQPSVYYEYSVNRPIYGEKEQVESAIRVKLNRVQHAYITFAVKKTMVLAPEEEVKDAIGLPLIKVKEGSLRPDRLINFTHNGIVYSVDENGHLQKMRA